MEGDQILVTRDHGYALDIDPTLIDAHRFEGLVAGVRHTNGDPRHQIDRLDEAMALWRGDAYADVGYEDFAQIEIRRLDALHESAMEHLLAARLSLGVDGQLVGELEAVVARHPLHERPVELLMTALYRSGRQADALKAYRAFEVTIGKELGIEPSPELRRLEEQVLLHDMGVTSPTARGRDAVGNPFKGLQVFKEEDAGSFFGRERVTSNLVHRIGSGERLITLVGASGSGKSSIVRAGLIPALRKQSLPRSDHWLIATMVPGSQPFLELESALLRSSLDAPASLGEQLADREAGILRAVLRVLPDEDSRLVLVIDQMEELFTLTQDENTTSRFLDGLLEAAEDPKGRLTVVATLRADFYSQILGFSRFGSAMGEGVVNVVPLLPDELEEAAIRPAELAGSRLEPALLGTLISDVLGRPGSLPLFEYALTDLFEQAEGGDLTLDAYHIIGGLAGSLTNRAESLYQDLDASQQEAAHRLFLRLVTIADHSEWGRRRVPATELLSLDIDTLDLQQAINSFALHGLLTTDRDPATGDPTVEVAHEALLTEWIRLRTWIEEAKDDLRRYAVLATAVQEWFDAERDDGYLWTGKRLDDYEAWAAAATIDLTGKDREFLRASVALRDREAAVLLKTRRSGRRRLAALVGAVGGGSAVLSVVITSPGAFDVQCSQPWANDPLIAVSINVEPPEPTVEMTLVFDGTTCEIASGQLPAVGDVAKLVLSNTSSDPTHVSLHRMPPGSGFQGEKSVLTRSRSALSGIQDVGPAEEAEVIAVFTDPDPWAATCWNSTTQTAVDGAVHEIGF